MKRGVAKAVGMGCNAVGGSMAGVSGTAYMLEYSMGGGGGGGGGG